MNGMILKKGSILYHKTNVKIKNLHIGKLIWMSDKRLDETMWDIKNNKKKIIKDVCCSYNYKSPSYEFILKKNLKLLKMNELLLNILIKIYGNEYLINYLISNNLNGFCSNKIDDVTIFFIYVYSNSDLVLNNLLPSKSERSYYDNPSIIRRCRWSIIQILDIIFRYKLYIFFIKLIFISISRYKLKQYKLKSIENKNLLPIKNKDNLRIISYNVHSFRSYNYKNTFNIILSKLEKLNIDILCLQEVITNKNKLDNIIFYNINTVIEKLKTKKFLYFFYDKKSFLLVASKVKIYDKKIFDISIKDTRKALNFNINFGKNKINITNTHLYTNTNLHKNNQEEEDIRFLQTKKLLSKINTVNTKNKILLGDFNSLNLNDYSDDKLHEMRLKEHSHTPNKMLVIPKILENNWIDTFSGNNIYTSINKRRVDYIFIKNFNLNYKYYNLYNFEDSDHSIQLIDLQN